MPRFSDDDYVDFCVLEALVTKGGYEQEEAAKSKEQANWRGKDERQKWAKEQGLV